MLRQLSRLIGLYFVCYCMPVSNAGLTMHNSLLNGHVFKTYVGVRQDRYVLLLQLFCDWLNMQVKPLWLKRPVQ